MNSTIKFDLLLLQTIDGLFCHSSHWIQMMKKRIPSFIYVKQRDIKRNLLFFHFIFVIDGIIHKIMNKLKKKRREKGGGYVKRLLITFE
jgi:hypothetical protein